LELSAGKVDGGGVRTRAGADNWKGDVRPPEGIEGIERYEIIYLVPRHNTY
jgi:hypothetical protein